MTPEEFAKTESAFASHLVERSFGRLCCTLSLLNDDEIQSSYNFFRCSVGCAIEFHYINIFLFDRLTDVLRESHYSQFRHYVLPVMGFEYEIPRIMYKINDVMIASTDISFERRTAQNFSMLFFFSALSKPLVPRTASAFAKFFVSINFTSF